MQLIQDSMVIVFGLVLIIVLLVVLRYVHKQASKMKQLESELNAAELVEKAAADTTEKEDK